MGGKSKYAATVHKKHRRRRSGRIIGILLVLVIMIAALTGYLVHFASAPEPVVEPMIVTIAEQAESTQTAVPKALMEMLKKNPEAAEFVWSYPLKYDMKMEIDLSNCLNSDGVPLLLQWDERWGYTQYAGNFMGASGCGPTCLSMVCLYLLQDAKYTPRYIADFATENGYSVNRNGSAWTLISKGGPQLGLDVTEIPLVRSRIIQNLKAGNPIICVMGPGIFTTTGHYIVMTGYEDGFVKVNDPNSPNRSEQLWDLTEVMKEIRNLWVCRVSEG